MKRVIRANDDNYAKRKRMQELVRFLAWEGVEEHTMLFKFLDDLDVDTTTRLLEELADECDVDLSEFEG